MENSPTRANPERFAKPSIAARWRLSLSLSASRFAHSTCADMRPPEPDLPYVPQLPQAWNCQRKPAQCEKFEEMMPRRRERTGGMITMWDQCRYPRTPSSHSYPASRRCSTSSAAQRHLARSSSVDPAILHCFAAIALRGFDPRSSAICQSTPKNILARVFGVAI